MNGRLILASQSPRRCELLKQTGLEFEVVPSRVKEDRIGKESPRQHVRRLARAKALEVATQYPDRWVIGADTIVLIDGKILGKPGNRKEAVRMLRRLNGREHQVLTGFNVLHLEKKVESDQTVRTAVRIKTLSREEMEWYVTSEEPFDKAGGYAIQGVGAFMIESIRGSYTNVVGLPLSELMDMLSRLGAIEISDCARLDESPARQGFRIVG